MKRRGDRSKVQWLRAKDLREQYGMDPKTMVKWVELGFPLEWVTLPPRKDGGRGERRYSRASIEASLNEMKESYLSLAKKEEGTP